ncbi:MAG TPA: metallophosphoesterase family protein [Candidatus Limnocylindrales bacterium]|nr:metallophosphoesterase family protein [Candidatus Limnocylindrales bacterium]
MRVALLSDIHANLPALEAILGALAPYDAVWHLGDCVGYGPDPDAVVDRLRAEDALGVRGNHEAATLGRIEASWFNDDARAAIVWTAAHISDRTRAWLAEQPERRTEDRFTLVHGSPRDPTWEYVHSAAVARANLALLETPHALLGHTHDPRAFREDDGRVETLAPAPGSHLQLDERPTLINPGSVGQPRDGDPRASAALLDTEARTVGWIRVAYDIAAVQARMRSADLPGRLIARLEVGR